MTATKETCPSASAAGVKTVDPVAVDFESFYSSEYSISDLGVYGYTHDPRFDAYLVSIVGEGIEYVGHPKGAPWKLIAHRPWVSHNKGFDAAVYKRIVELGWAPDLWPPAWHCTANLCVYVGLPRSLKGAVQAAFDSTISKDIRDRDIKGKTWAEFGEELQKKVLLYALDDSRWCLELWNKYSDQWPEHERRLSELTYAQGERGVYIDAAGVDKDIQLLERVKFEAEQKIPWREDYVTLSRKGLQEECRKVGIEPPASLAMNDEACADWEDKYGDQYPWVGAMRDFRRSNALLEKYKTMRSRIQPNGRMGYSLLYGGAHTLRFSGSGGFNFQNLPRAPFYFDSKWGFIRDPEKIRVIAKHVKKTGQLPDWVAGSVDLRSKIIAAPGKKLVISDYSQIEARVTPWIAGDAAMMNLIREGINVYEAHARTYMGWTGGVLKDEDPILYQLAKARVLGLGFNLGWFRFPAAAKTLCQLDDETFESIFGAEISDKDTNRFLEYLSHTDREGKYIRQWKKLDDRVKRHWVNSWVQVSDFRAKNPKIVALWKKLDNALRQSIGEDFIMELPSGRCMRYFNVNDTDGGSIQARTTRGDHFRYFYGGMLTENLVQATARDVFAEALLRVNDASLDIVMHTHDEIVIEVDEDFDGERLVELMVQTPAWARTLPINAEMEESKVYCK